MLKQLISRRFLKFGAVGASGVLVNLACLWICADLLALHANLASALAIEASIASNFLLNDAWTFSDRRGAGRGALNRASRFHLVSALGAGAQWAIFVASNLLWLVVALNGSRSSGYFEGAGWLQDYVIKPVTHPPEVGNMKYLSQLIGIAAAMVWNFFANFYWTWREPEAGGD